MRVDLEELYMWPLASPTTCYSGARNVVSLEGSADDSIDHHSQSSEDNVSYAFSSCLATALHSMRVFIASEMDSPFHASKKEPHVQWEPVPQSNSIRNRPVCVGCAANASFVVLALLADLDAFLQAFNRTTAAVLDDETTQQLRELISNTTSSDAATSHDADTASVTTATAASVLTEPSAPTSSHHAVRSSSTDFDMASSTAGNGDQIITTNNDSYIPTSGTAESASSLTHQVSAASTTFQHANAAADMLLKTNTQGWLIWRDAHDSVTIRGTLEIEFRPLAMTLATIPFRESDEHQTQMRPVVWMGSADTARLLAYCWIDETSQLQPLVLDEDCFDVSSPVMAIDFQEKGTGDNTRSSYHLAFACQDGTVRSLSISHYNSQTQSWTVTQISQVIVDGPLVCLKFLKGTTGLLVGSLCGYVMLQDEEGSPSLVAAELESQKGIEDSVLAVHGWNDWVAIGTQGGALLLYRKNKTVSTSPSYIKAGELRLPYSIHEICHIGTENGLLVTTRRTLHWFRMSVHDCDTLDASLARERIQRFLQMSEDRQRRDRAKTDSRVHAQVQDFEIRD